MQRTTYFGSQDVSILEVEEGKLYLLLYISLFAVLVSLFWLSFSFVFWSFVIVTYCMIINLVCPYRCFMYMFTTNLR